MMSETIAIAVGNDAPRDVRLAAALMIYAAKDVRMLEPKAPVQFSFTMYEEDCDFMSEICRMAAWKPDRFNHMQKTLSAVASKLASWRYLDQYTHRRNEEAMENNEPTRWHMYSSPFKYRARLNPSAWKGYNPDHPPEWELEYLLRRVFNFEGTVSPWTY